MPSPEAHESLHPEQLQLATSQPATTRAADTTMLPAEAEPAPSWGIPETQSAVTQDEHGRPRLTTGGVAVPRLTPGTVLVRTAAVALNPSDHKMGASFPTPGAVVGMDFAGTVVATAADDGPGPGPGPGSLVCGAVQGSNPAAPDNGAFAEYVRAPADLLLRVPPRLGAPAAATLGTALATCALALWSRDALDLLPATPDAPSRAAPRAPVLVYGASSATGTVAVQLLALSGLEPVAACSPPNFGLVRSRGAVAVFDYAADGVAAAIRAHTGGRLRHALDCVADARSAACCYAAMARAGGRYAALELVGDGLLARRRAVRPSLVMAPEVFGRELRLPGAYGRPASPEKHQLAARLFAMFQRLLDEGRLAPHPVELLPGGLGAVAGGLELLRSGAVSGRKLVAMV